jgi:uncharacterized protein involved in exopolysaccharide biosynthesis
MLVALRWPPLGKGILVTEFEQAPAARRTDVFTAARRHWFVALVPLVLFVGAAVLLGVKRTPQYTATASVSVGPVFLSNPAGISSVIQGTESLATVYSRLIDANAVRDDTARRLSIASTVGAGSVSATPLPDSPLIRVRAVAGSERAAVALVNAISDSLAAYVNRNARSDKSAASIAGEYRRAALAYRRRVALSRRLDRRYDEDPSAANRLARDRAAAEADTALLRRDALSPAYENSVQVLGSTPALKVFARATSASSDRYQVLQMLVFTGLVGGLLAGLALALLRDVGERRPVSG